MKIRSGINLRSYTTFGIGGKADFFCDVSTLEEMRTAFDFSDRHGLPFIVIGGGSNLLVSDDGVPGLVIRLANTKYEINGTRLIVGAGMSLDRFVDKTVSAGLRGPESLSGIPGTVGGAVYGNAGAWGKSLGDMVYAVRCFEVGALKEFPKENCGFGYRSSIFKTDKDKIVWEIELDCEAGDPVPLRNLRQAILAYRAVRYPRRAKSAGSFFKNVPVASFSDEILASLPLYAFSGKEISAGYLIEQVGFLGKRFKGAQICPHQGNFFVNRRHASSNDVVELARMTRAAVQSRFGVLLEPEVQCLGFKDNQFDNPSDSLCKSLS